MSDHAESEPAPPSKTGRVAGIDYGTVRIGVAISDPDRMLASGLANYTRRGQDGDARWFQELVKENRIVQFVVGLPVHLSGRESQKSFEAREFGIWLGQVTGLRVEYFDERFTTREAEALLQDANLTSKRRKKVRDMLAAQILLTAYLESGCQGVDDPGSLDD